MKRAFLFFGLMAITLMAQAQRQQDNTEQRVRMEMQGRNARLVKGDESARFWMSTTFWTDGEHVFMMSGDGSKGDKLRIDDVSYDENGNAYSNRTMTFNRKKDKVTVKGDGGTIVSHELLGKWDMLVFRDGKAIKDIWVSVGDNVNTAALIMEEMLHSAYDGVYQLQSVEECADNSRLAPLGTEVVFGPPSYIIGNNEKTAPGEYIVSGKSIIFGLKYNAVPTKPDVRAINTQTGVRYFKGNGTEISKEDFLSELNGYNNAFNDVVATDMTIWQLNMTEQGMKVVANHGNGITYSPYCGERFQLTKIADGYPELDGLYGMASVKPMLKGVLKKFPQVALRVMRWEIWARNGAPVADPKYQSYFERQSWYHPDKNYPQLSDVELLNYALLQTVEKEK